MEENKKEKDEFDKVNDKLDRVFKKDGEQARQKSKIYLKPTTYMTISDVNVEDAQWFKQFSDKYFEGKQFNAIKVIRQIMERFDPLVTNILDQINQLNKRMDGYELILEQVIKKPEPEKEYNIPKTQGSKKRLDNGVVQ